MQARAADPLGRARELAPRHVHDVAEDLREVLVEVRRRHQGDESTHRIEADPGEVPVPVDGGKPRDGPRIGARDMDGGAERPGERVVGGLFIGSASPVRMA